MEKLVEFVLKHSQPGTCECGRCADLPEVQGQPTGHTADLCFFKIVCKDDPNKDEFRALIQSAKGNYELDVFDGEEHSYIQIGGWIGSQELALRFMGIGAILGMWRLMTPKMIPIPEDLAMEMAGQGMITIQAAKSVTKE